MDSSAPAQTASQHRPNVDDWNRLNPHQQITPVKKLHKLEGESAEEDVCESARSGDRRLSELNRARGMLLPEDSWPTALREFAAKWSQYKKSTRTSDFCDLIEASVRDLLVAPRLHRHHRAGRLMDHVARTTMTNAEANTSAAVAEQGAHVAPNKASSKKGASQEKGVTKGQRAAKAAKPAKEAKPKKAAKPARKEATTPRAESKGAKILEMIGHAHGRAARTPSADRAWPRPKCRN